jgi:acylphosphatase
MNVDFNCKRIIIEGYTSFDIQGKNLRETIEEFVKKPKNGKFLDIQGSVENLKDGRVELIYRGKGAESFHTQLEEDLKMKGYKFKQEFQPAPHYLPEIERLSDFTIKRADDISEMVLALRGAGYRFVESTKTLEKIYQSNLDRDNKIMEGKLRALHYELTYIEKQMDESSIRRFFLPGAIDANIRSPAIPEIEFVHKLMSAYIDLQEFRLENKDPSHLKRSLVALRNIIEKKLSESVTSK